MTDQPEQQPLTPADQARADLDTIRRGWAHVLDPIATTSTSSAIRNERPATEDEADEQLPPDARFDTPRTLAFWVHAALDEWPTILQTLEPGPDGNLRLTTTKSVDCGSVYEMADLLHAEADRLADWVDSSGHDFGATFTADIGKLARAVSRVAWPPKGDRITIGDCPACGRRVRVKAPEWVKRPIAVPQPTTNPKAHAEWTTFLPDGAEWEPDRDRPIACRCGLEDTLDGWHGRMVPFEEREPKTAAELMGIIRERMGLRYQSAAIVRQWKRQGLIDAVGTSDKGESLYDPVQVLAALVDREKRRDQAAS